MRWALVALLGLVAGCLPSFLRPVPPFEFYPAHPDWPDDVDREDHWFRGADGVELYGQAWRGRGAIRAAVVIVHGSDEQSDRYTVFAGRLAQAGHAVHAFDLRGHGRSEGPRGATVPLASHADDLAAFVDQVRRLEPGRPIVLFGAGVGGTIVVLYLVERAPAIDAVVLSGPLLMPPISPVTVAGRGALWSVGWGEADPVLDALPRIWAGVDRLTAPLLIVQGSADPLTRPAGSHDLVARAAARDRTLTLYPEGRDDLLGGRSGAQVAADILAWLDARADGAALEAAVLLATPAPPHGLTGTVQVGYGVEHHVGAERAEEVELTIDLAAHLTWGRPGWLGGVRAQLRPDRGEASDSASLHLLGGFVPLRGSGLLGVTGGVGSMAGFGLVIPVEVTAEVPLGGLRVLGNAELAWDPYGNGGHDRALGIADAASLLVGLRIGGERRYWRTVEAGGGLYVGLTYRQRGDIQSYGVQLGGHLSGRR